MSFILFAQSDQVDAKDPPDAHNRKSVLKNVAGHIIATEFCEVGLFGDNNILPKTDLIVVL